ncbi:hypothetical protein M9H77_22147 [Catharanthus roseus]|uniref:Uncharacterized protein n=1 Tax=Catharanthus roseus TaxID=4058 RepID=A0ACC0AQK1_CATRO|nr:hypothetical protein M9H77_22147 [Catharanthus roseus]
MLCGGFLPPSEESRGTRHRGWSHGRPDAELVFDDLILRFGPCPSTQDKQRYDKSLKLRAWNLGPCFSRRTCLCSGCHVLCFVFLRLGLGVSLVPRGTQIPYSAAVSLVAGLGVSQMGILVSGSCGTTPSLSYSLRENVPDRDPIPIIDLSDSETVEGPEVQEVEPGVSIEEEPSEGESDVGMLPEQEGAAPRADPRYHYHSFWAIVYGVSSRWRSPS